MTVDREAKATAELVAAKNEFYRLASLQAARQALDAADRGDLIESLEQVDDREIDRARKRRDKAAQKLQQVREEERSKNPDRGPTRAQIKETKLRALSGGSGSLALGTQASISTPTIGGDAVKEG